MLVAAIFVSLAIAHCLVNIFTSEEYPAAIENDVYMELFLVSVLFNTCSVDANNVTNASNLRTILYSLSVKNTVDKLVAFSRLVPKRIVRLVNHLNRANILVVCGFVG